MEGIHSLEQWWPISVTIVMHFLWQGVHVSKKGESLLVQLLLRNKNQLRIQRGNSDSWAEGHRRGPACGLRVTACVHRLAGINILKKWKDLLCCCGSLLKGNPPAWLSQQGCNTAGGLIALPWSEISQITPSHTCLDR